MNLVFDAPQWLALLLALLLIVAAIEDAARLRISNWTSLAILVAAFAAVVIEGPEPELWQNIVVFGVILGIGTLLFAVGKLGGGDVKLLAVSGLWFDIMGALNMLLYVFLAGGALALLILALRFFKWSDAVRERVHLLKPQGGIPYGVAIATGVLIAMALAR
jgi:prepilin peptidase CpaA